MTVHEIPNPRIGPQSSFPLAANGLPDIPYTGLTYYAASLRIRGPWPGRDAPHNIRLELDLNTAVKVSGHVAGPARDKAAEVMAEHVFREIMHLGTLMDTEGARVDIDVTPV